MRLNECKRLCIDYISKFEDKKYWTDIIKSSRISTKESLRIPEMDQCQRKNSIKDLNNLESSDLTDRILQNISAKSID